MRIPATFALLLIVSALALFVGDAQPSLAAWPGRDGAIVFVDGNTGQLTTMSDTGDRRELLTEDTGNDPKWSPDGKQVAYQRGSDVWVVNSDGSNDRMVTAGGFPAWTPDFRLLVTSTPGLDILLVSLNGQILSNLTNTAGIAEFGAVMSPDGTMIAYSSNEDPAGDPNNPTTTTHTSLWIMDANGSNRQVLWESDELDPHYYGQLDWAPDSNRIAFNDNYEIWTTPPDGNNQTNLTDDDAKQSYPAWSPDGTLVAYSEENPVNQAKAQIYTINVDTRARTNLTNDTDADDYAPHWQSWAPQNGRIAYVSSDVSIVNGQGGSGFGAVIDSMSADGSHVRSFGSSYEDLRAPVWSPDGSKIAFQTGTSTYVFDPVTGVYGFATGQGILPAWFPNSRGLIVTNGDLLAFDTASSAQPVNITNTANVSEADSAVSPDSRWIVFSSNEIPGGDPNNPMPGSNYDLYMADIDGLSRNPIVQSATYQGSPSWSPDGKRVAYQDGFDIWIVDPFNPIDRTNLTNDALMQEHPEWSPDGKLIAFDQTAGSSNHQIWTINAQTKARVKVTRDLDAPDSTWPTWQPIYSPGSNNYFVWGDQNCDGKPGLVSILDSLRLMSGLEPAHIPGCPVVGEEGLTSTNVQTTWGNWDCTAGITGVDLVLQLEYIAEVSADAIPGPPEPAGNPDVDCPRIADYIQWIPLGS